MNNTVDFSSPPRWPHTLLLKFFLSLLNFLANEEGFEISTSVLFLQHFLSVLFLVEVVDDHSDKHVHDKESSAHHEADKVNDHAGVMILFLNFVDADSVDACPHDSSPTLRRGQDEQCPHSLDDVVKVTVTVGKLVARIKAVLFRHYSWSCSRARVKLPLEKTHSDHCENQKNEQTDHDNVADGRNRREEGIDYFL